MKAIKIIKFIGKIVAYPFEPDRFGVIVIVAIAIGFITDFELLIFKIPHRFIDKIWLGNIIFSFAAYLYGRKSKEKREDDLDT
jgi:predicted membrane channel-forming protein YqfA (hemolysin III family)